MRIFLAILMTLHGLAHIPGVLGSWRLATFAEMPYSTTLFGGRLDVGDAGMRVVGVLWLITEAGFVAAAAGALAQRPWWTTTALAACGLSVLLCVAMLPQARIGIPVDLVIAGAIILSARLPQVLRLT